MQFRSVRFRRQLQLTPSAPHFAESNFTKPAAISENGRNATNSLLESIAVGTHRDELRPNSDRTQADAAEQFVETRVGAG